MRSVALGKTELKASVLGFGCAPMGGRVSAQTALRALAAAHEHGVNYIDTARSYGYGEAERILGQFLKGRRDRFVVSTKCGIYAGRPSLPKRIVKAIARPILDALPSLRQSMRTTMNAQHAPGRFGVDEVSKSVHESLNELGTDYIDVLFLHEPDAATIKKQEVFELLEGFVKAGKLRAFGISAEPNVVAAYLNAPSGNGMAVQYAHNWLVGYPEQALQNRPETIAIGNQPFAGVAAMPQFKARLNRVAATLDANDTLRDRLQPKMLDSRSIADLALGLVLRDTRTQVSVCSMYQPVHIEANVAAIAASQFSDAELGRVRVGLAATR